MYYFLWRKHVTGFFCLNEKIIRNIMRIGCNLVHNKSRDMQDMRLIALLGKAGEKEAINQGGNT